MPARNGDDSNEEAGRRGPSPGPRGPSANATLRQRFGALRNLRPFIAIVWRTSPGLAVAALTLRLLRALLPVLTLYVGKLIIDQVVFELQAPNRPAALADWLASGRLNLLAFLILAEFALAVVADLLGRVVALVDSLLSERVTNASSVQLMEHAATLDLEDFEDAEFQDQLERARRQTSGRLTLMAQLLGQAQDIVTVASFAAELLVYAPWLIVLLLVALFPAFIGEFHFNAQSYTLDFGRTPERRELDYLRQTAASVETAKEVKIFGLSGFLIARYLALATEFYRRQPSVGGAAGALGCAVHRDRHDRLLRRLCLHRLAHAERRFLDRRPDLSGRLVPQVAHLVGGRCRACRPPPGRRSISTTCSPSTTPRPRFCRRRMRGRFRGRFATASCSTRSASSIPEPSGGRCATSPSPCARVRLWRWSERTATARPPWSSC